MAKYYNIEPRESATFRLDKNLNKDLVNYASIKGLNKSEAINEILFNFFKDTTLTNTYLQDKAELLFKIPLDLEVKKKFINNRIKLNHETDKIGNDTTLIKIDKIPNNLDVFTTFDDNIAGSFQSMNKNILHSGIDFIFIPDVIRKSKTSYYNKPDIDLLSALYVFYFEVTLNNNTDVYLINPYDAITKLSDVNNSIVGDKLIEIVAMLEDNQTQINYNYKTTLNNVSDDKKEKLEALEGVFTYLEMFVYDNVKNNENITITKSQY